MQFRTPDVSSIAGDLASFASRADGLGLDGFLDRVATREDLKIDLPTPPKVDHLADRLLCAPSSAERLGAAIVLGHWGKAARGATYALVIALTDTSWTVREAAAHALLQISPDDVIDDDGSGGLVILPPRPQAPSPILASLSA